MTKRPGRWNGILTSLVMFPAVEAALLTLWACCSIPCIHEWLAGAVGKTGRHECRRIWMEICRQFLYILPNDAGLLTWVLNCAIEGRYSNNVGSLVSLLQESNRLFSTLTITLSSLTMVQRLNFSDRFDRSDDLFGKLVLCSSQRWFHSWLQWCSRLSRCW